MNPNSTSPPFIPKVFISYSHDSSEHMNRVLELSDRLRAYGVDCSIDQYEMSPSGGWARWTEDEIGEADFVFVVCTETYLRRFKLSDKRGIGLGVKWEGAVITQELYDAEGNNQKFIPIVFSSDDVDHIPKTLRGVTRYDLSAPTGYEDLYRRLTNQPLVSKPGLGSLRPMRPRDRKQDFPAVTEPGEAVPMLPPDLNRQLTIQLRIIERHTKRFVGRSYVQTALKRFMAEQSRGYFIVRGGPGQGKTALSCRLIEDYGCIHHFVSRTGGHSDVRLILRSLLAQVRLRLKEEFEIPESLSELATSFEEASGLLVQKEGRLISVIDALDELAEQDQADLPFLFADSLADGAYVVVTSRPGAILNKLEEQLSTSPYEVFDLGPLQFSEVREILGSHRNALSEPETERIVEASQGNPLYLHAVIDELKRSPTFDLKELPRNIEGFFRRSTKSVRDSQNRLLHDVLGLLAVARKPLTVAELSEIIGKRQREIHDEGISPVRQFLLEVDDAYGFYHVGFHDFVTQEMLYQDELGECHRMLAAWLQRPTSRAYEYRWSSLAYHLFVSGQKADLSKIIDSAFLTEKVRRLGYAVLEDVELLTLSMLDAGDPAVVERCVDIVEQLREVAGGDIIEDATRAIQVYRPGPASFRTQLIAPPVESVPGFDVYVGMLPKVDVAADFFEVVPKGRNLIVAIGDVPAVGIKSAFVARFIGNVFRKLVNDTSRARVGRILDDLNAIVSRHEYFRWVSMQCVELNPELGILTIASAGHPRPVLYSARRGKSDRLPVHGDVLQSPLVDGKSPQKHEERHAEFAPGDILVLLTDGLTEAHLLKGEPYNYSFTKIVEQMAGQSAKNIGEAILDDWRAHPREADYADDVTVITIVVNDSTANSPGR